MKIVSEKEIENLEKYSVSIIEFLSVCMEYFDVTRNISKSEQKLAVGQIEIDPALFAAEPFMLRELANLIEKISR
jgi:hypothetical protein